MEYSSTGVDIYYDNMRELVLYIRQARAEVHIQLYIQVWIQGGGWVEEGT
jgi:hypothetical protein